MPSLSFSVGFYAKPRKIKRCTNSAAVTTELATVLARRRELSDGGLFSMCKGQESKAESARRQNPLSRYGKYFPGQGDEAKGASDLSQINSQESFSTSWDLCQGFSQDINSDSHQSISQVITPSSSEWLLPQRSPLWSGVDFESDSLLFNPEIYSEASSQSCEIDHSSFNDIEWLEEQHAIDKSIPQLQLSNHPCNKRDAGKVPPHANRDGDSARRFPTQQLSRNLMAKNVQHELYVDNKRISCCKTDSAATEIFHSSGLNMDDSDQEPKISSSVVCEDPDYKK